MLGVIGVPSSSSSGSTRIPQATGPRGRFAMSSQDKAVHTVALHQPHYLPWLGLLDKIDRCDRFVILDNVQFERRGWQNRNYVAGGAKPVLLTVPVVQGSRHDRIRDKIVDNSQNWKLRHYKALSEHCYRKAPYWRDYRDEIAHLYEEEWDGLADLCIATTRMLMRWFGIDTPLLLASEIGDFPGRKSELLAQICTRAGAHTMLSGDGARDYLEPETLRRYGIDVRWQDFRHPVYPQHGRDPADFVPRLSAIDLLLNTGPEALHVLRQARTQS